MVPENAPHRLIVEGPNDKHTIIHLMKLAGLDWDKPDPRAPFMEEAGGYEKALESVGISIKTRYERLGIVIDANRNPADHWAQLRSRLARADVNLPESPIPEGTVVPGAFSGNSLGVWLMPDNQRPGALEHLLIDMIPQDSPLWPFVQETTREARNRGASFPENALDKASVHTWLAWQEEPGLPFGSAVKAHYFRTNCKIASAFIAWFRRLFLETPA